MNHTIKATTASSARRVNRVRIWRATEESSVTVESLGNTLFIPWSSVEAELKYLRGLGLLGSEYFMGREWFRRLPP